MAPSPNYDNVDFEDDATLLNKDIQVRRRYMKWFNKRREDFDSDAAYDDYLEMVENIIYNMVNNIDVEATKQRVERYRRQHQHEIGQNQAKRVDEFKADAERVVMLERLRTARLNEIRMKELEEEEERKRKLRREHAEQLVRFSKGDDEYNRMVKKRQKAEMKKRKREAEALRLAEAQAKADAEAVMIRPTYQQLPPSVIDSGKITTDMRPVSRTNENDPKRLAVAATAAGFRQVFVYTRAKMEFEQALMFAEQHSTAVCSL